MLKALIVNLVATYVGTRTPAALAASGFETALAAYPGSVFFHSGRLAKHFRLQLDSSARVAQVARKVAQAIEQWEPDLIVAQDATAHQVLNYLGSREARNFASAEVVARVHRCLGINRPADLHTLRATLQSTASALGLPVIPHGIVHCLGDVIAFAAEQGWPVVLKRENTQNGEGIAICADEREAGDALGKWAVAENNPVMVQKHLAGPVIRHSLSAIDGRVLAEVTGIQIHGRRNDPLQAPTVIELTHIPRVSAISAQLVNHWQLTGFSGFDFLHDSATGDYYLIDHNPRINSLSHLGALAGRDLSEALYAGLQGRTEIPSVPAPRDTPKVYASLFPFESQRDPGSIFLRHSPSDTPWDDPPLMAAIIRRFHAIDRTHTRVHNRGNHLPLQKQL